MVTFLTKVHPFKDKGGGTKVQSFKMLRLENKSLCAFIGSSTLCKRFLKITLPFLDKNLFFSARIKTTQKSHFSHNK